MPQAVGIKKGQSGVSYRYDEELVVPIIENTPFERDLKASMRLAMEQYPDTCAVLVRRHGVYVWGDSWQRAKTMLLSHALCCVFCAALGGELTDPTGFTLNPNGTVPAEGPTTYVVYM
ncbi:hypothetical protein V5799_022280 [Amblyomma americanum]|uniref:Class II aldolase/adducin N-terminal domain-containing protein n=1 Tax=Amblyomma americanum TaxID=6943 RepID=A0AAQ4FMK1_AMBAM